MEENLDYKQLDYFRRAESERKGYDEKKTENEIIKDELIEACNEEQDIKIMRELYLMVLIRNAIDNID